jgi:hypothetical protein
MMSVSGVYLQEKTRVISNFSNFLFLSQVTSSRRHSQRRRDSSRVFGKNRDTTRWSRIELSQTFLSNQQQDLISLEYQD